MSEPSPVRAELSAAVLKITLVRPERRNALNAAAYAALAQALTRAAETDVRAVVLTGEGERAFCAGHDLGEMKGDDPAGDLRFVDGVVRAIRALPKPVVAAINGAAVGGGLSLAQACDVRLMAEDARLIGGFLTLALVPDFGASWLLARQLGYHRAFDWIASGRPLSAAEALAAGLVEEVLPRAELAAAASRRAEALAALPTRALGLTKQLLSQALHTSFETALEAEAAAQALAAETADYREGLAAFRERRDPRFTGR